MTNTGKPVRAHVFPPYGTTAQAITSSASAPTTPHGPTTCWFLADTMRRR